MIAHLLVLYVVGLGCVEWSGLLEVSVSRVVVRKVGWFVGGLVGWSAVCLDRLGSWLGWLNFVWSE